MCKILHIYKKSYQAAKHTYLGSTKDIMSRKEYFKSRNIQVDEILALDKTKYDKYLKESKNIDWTKYDAVLMEMTFSPKAIKYIRQKSPGTKIIVRSHNAELLHRIHWSLAEGISKNAIKYLLQAIRYFHADLKFGLHADAVLSIDEWECKNYWSRISKRDNVYHVPFYITDEYEKDLKNTKNKLFNCVNFTSSSMNPIIRDATNNFIKIISKLDGKAEMWKFLITGNLANNKIKIPEQVIKTGWLENPYSVLRESRAMALLSNFGFGFKTKILEAIIAKTYILMPTGLLNRMSKEFRRYCIPVDPTSPTSFLGALDKCTKPFEDNNLNGLLKKKAFSAMDRVFFD